MYEFETNSGAKTIEAGIGYDGTGTIETRKGNTPIKVWVFLTKTAKGQFWLFLPEKLCCGWLSHNLSQ